MVHDCILLGLAASKFVVIFFLILQSFMQINDFNVWSLLQVSEKSILMLLPFWYSLAMRLNLCTSDLLT